MYFYIIPPVYVLAHLILFAVWNLWLSSASDRYRKNKKMHWVLLAAIVLASLPSLLGCFLPESRVQSSLAAIGNIWLGIFFYVGGISVLLAMFVSFPMFVYGRVSSGRGRGFWGVIGSILSSWKKVHRGLIIGTLLAALILNVYGIIHAVDIKVHEFTVSVDKPLVIDGEKKDSLKVVLIDGSFHPVDSDQLSFELAARFAYKAVCQKAGPVLMEPIMKLEVVTPEENMGDVIGDLNKRRGQVEGMEEGRSGGRIIKAMVPLAEMFGYVTALRTITSGRATSSMEYDHHAPLSSSIAKTVLEEIKGRVDLV